MKLPLKVVYMGEKSRAISSPERHELVLSAEEPPGNLDTRGIYLAPQ